MRVYPGALVEINNAGIRVGGMKNKALRARDFRPSGNTAVVDVHRTAERARPPVIDRRPSPRRRRRHSVTVFAGPAKVDRRVAAVSRTKRPAQHTATTSVTRPSRVPSHSPTARVVGPFVGRVLTAWRSRELTDPRNLAEPFRRGVPRPRAHVFSPTPSPAVRFPHFCFVYFSFVRRDHG